MNIPWNLTDVDSAASAPVGHAPESAAAALIDSFGGPDALHLGAVPLPPPGNGMLGIRVAAAAVNPVDTTTRAGVTIAPEHARLATLLVNGPLGAVGRFLVQPAGHRSFAVAEGARPADGQALPALGVRGRLDRDAFAHRRLQEGGLRGRLALVP